MGPLHRHPGHLHLPAVFAFALRHPAAYALMRWLLVVAGVVFFAQMGSARLPPLVLALYVASAMPTTDAIGLWLLLDPRVVFPLRGERRLTEQRWRAPSCSPPGNILLVIAAWSAGRYLWAGRPTRS